MQLCLVFVIIGWSWFNEFSVILQKRYKEVSQSCHKQLGLLIAVLISEGHIEVSRNILQQLKYRNKNKQEVETYNFNDPIVSFFEFFLVLVQLATFPEGSVEDIAHSTDLSQAL